MCGLFLCEEPCLKTTCLLVSLSQVDAEHWWRSARLLMEATHVAVDWVAFRNAFLERFYPLSAREEQETKFLTLQQGSMTVDEYAAKLESLSRHFRFFAQNVDEVYLCSRFLKGLRYEIERSVRPLGILLYHPLVEKCREIEMMESDQSKGQSSEGAIRSGAQDQDRPHKGKKRQGGPYQRPSGEGTTVGQYQPMVAALGEQKMQNQSQSVTCFKCGKNDHYAKNCQEKNVMCYKCRKSRHIARDCQASRADVAENSEP